MKTSAVCLALALVACGSPARLEAEPSAAPPAQPPVQAVPASTASPSSNDAPKKLPVLGDPLGLLSRPPERAEIALQPAVREAAQRYYGRGVEFVAASVDRDREAMAAYVPTLEGVFPARLITADGTTARELKRLGVPLKGDGFSIPLVAVLDRSERILAYGTSGLASRIAQTLEPLADP